MVVNQIALTFIFLVCFLLLLVFNELVYRRFNPRGEVTRKFAHFTATLSTITFPYLFTSHWYVLFLAVVFFLILFFSRLYTYLRSIHDIERISAGSYILPVSIYLTFLIAMELENRLFFILPILVLAVSDPVAGILGMNLQQYNHKIRIFNHKLQKTWLGSASFFVSCFFISILALYFDQKYFDLHIFWLALLIGLVSTVTEMFSWKGTDNLFIPMSVLVVLIIFHP
jgi:phytol kinase